MRIIKKIIQGLLYLSIISLFLSCVITLLIGVIQAYVLNYFVVFFSFFTILVSMVVLIIVTILKILKKQRTFLFIKREVILVFLNIVLLLLLGFITNYVAPN